MADEPNNTPVSDTPKADVPVADTPKADTPKADAPADTPAADAPKADAPKDGDAPKDAPKADAPADYTALKLPQGYKADDPVFADAVKLFEGEKISPDQAQKLIDFTVERVFALCRAPRCPRAPSKRSPSGGLLGQVDANFYSLQTAQHTLDLGADLHPVEAAIPRTQGRQRNRADAMLLDDGGEVFQP